MQSNTKKGIVVVHYADGSVITCPKVDLNLSAGTSNVEMVLSGTFPKVAKANIASLNILMDTAKQLIPIDVNPECLNECNDSTMKVNVNQMLEEHLILKKNYGIEGKTALERVFIEW